MAHFQCAVRAHPLTIPVGRFKGTPSNQWTKQVESHFGGTRTGLIVNWPAKFQAHGEVRTQLHHVVDIAPTIYEAAGIKMPEYFDGVKQIRLVGVSMGYKSPKHSANSGEGLLANPILALLVSNGLLDLQQASLTFDATCPDFLRKGRPLGAAL